MNSNFPINKLETSRSAREAYLKTIKSLNQQGWQKRIPQVAQVYEAWCSLNRKPSFPLSYSTLSRYLSHYVTQNNGSSKSVGNVVSALKNYSLLHSHAWLNDSDSYKLKLFVKELEYQDKIAVKRARPATLETIFLVGRHLNSSKPQEHMFFVSMLLAHNGVLRAGELFSGIKVGDLIWDQFNKVVTIQIGRTKTHRKGGPIEVLIRDYKGVSAYKLLVHWMNKYHLWSQPNSYIIPYISGRSGRINFSIPETIGKFRYRLKTYFAKAGLPDKKFTGHSFRAGAATDLFSMGVPVHEVQKIGRWKSMAVLIYYRAEAIEVATKASKAFAMVCLELHCSKRVV